MVYCQLLHTPADKEKDSDTHCSGGVGSLALAEALFDKVMNINIELLMSATEPPHFMRHYYVCMRSAGLAWTDWNSSS